MRLANIILLWGTIATGITGFPMAYIAVKYRDNWPSCLLLPAAIIIMLCGFFALLASIYGLISILLPKRCKSGILLPLMSMVIGITVLLMAFILPAWDTMKVKTHMEEIYESKQMTNEPQQGGPGCPPQDVGLPDP